MSFKNTLKSGKVRSVIFHQGGEWLGAALEFNIVETGDSPEEVMVLLDNAIKGYIIGARKKNLSVSVLNQEIDSEYETLWNKGNRGAPASKGTKVYSSSSQPIAAFV